MMTNLLDDCHEHGPAEFWTDSIRIACLERQVATLLAQVASLTQQLILIREDEPRQIAAQVNEAVDVLDTSMADLLQRVEDRLNAVDASELSIKRRLAALEAGDKQTIRHGMDNDTDIANIKRRLEALERQRSPDLNAEQVAHIVGLGGGIAWGGLD